MTLTPLPVPTRLYGGEDVDTYARRAAGRNGTDVRLIEKALWDRRIVRSLSRRHPDRLQAWRELGALHPSAFTVPQVLMGERVTDRLLCLQCASGQEAYGRLPTQGQVCVRHKRWMGSTDQPRLHSFPAALTAERHYRATLATRLVLFDSAAMTIAAECARMAVSPTTITTRQETSGGLPVDAVLYPEQVAFARVLTRGSLLAWATDPATDPVDVRSALDAESRRIVPATEDNEPWRASTRMQTVLFALRSHRRQQYLAPGAAVQPDRWNLLRHSDELGLPAAVAGVLSAVG